MRAEDDGKASIAVTALLHVLFLPYFATGHIILPVNAARLFAHRVVNVSILTTHHNASLFRSSIDGDDTRSIISVHTLRFPSEKPMEDKIREIRPGLYLSGYVVFGPSISPWSSTSPGSCSTSPATYDLKKSPAERFLTAGNEVPTSPRLRRSKLWHRSRHLLRARTSCADYYQKMKNNQIKELVDAADEYNSCAVVEWLNEQKHKSVLYVSFGSSVRFPEDQLTEIAKALEASEPSLFIWVVRKDQSAQTTWLPDGFEERAKKKGVIIRGWAPQLTILDHSAVGGFMSHCGWNSVLEAIVAGAVADGPVFAEQFYNEKLVEVMGLGGKGAEVVTRKALMCWSPMLGSEKTLQQRINLWVKGKSEN
ncbi:hypothetical protein HAX54_041590 [Datura stramonium]|uniref:Uncharacterized protein n=1 Tax=Datura stramonium TaxID=4076 RepID=A0ABS8W1S2_DATST|nr:hypothetical protein [Datura stramonium]